MKIRGIQDGRMREVVEATLESPEWEFAGFTGTTHGVLRHIPSGQTVTFGTTPNGGAFKSLAIKVRRISGLVVWKQASRKPGTTVRRVERTSRRTIRDMESFQRAADAEARRREDARRAAEAERKRREIERLMQGGLR